MKKRNFIREWWIIDDNICKKPITLCLRKNKCSNLIKRILCRKNEKRIRKFFCLSCYRYLLLLHKLKHSRLNFRCCSINFISENNIVISQRSSFYKKFVRHTIENLWSNNIWRHHISSTLNPSKRQSYQTGKNMNTSCFC